MPGLVWPCGLLRPLCWPQMAGVNDYRSGRLLGGVNATVHVGALGTSQSCVSDLLIAVVTQAERSGQAKGAGRGCRQRFM